MGLEPRTQTSRTRGKPLEPPGRYLNKGSGENDVYAARVQLDAGSLQSISKPKYDVRASNRQTMPVTQVCFSSFCGTFSGPTAPVAHLLAQVSLALNKYRGGVCSCHSTIPTYYPLLIIIVRPPCQHQRSIFTTLDRFKCIPISSDFRRPRNRCTAEHP